MPFRPRPGIEKLLPSSHGGINLAELKVLGLKPEKIIDFSVRGSIAKPNIEVRIISVFKEIGARLKSRSPANKNKTKIPAITNIFAILPKNWIGVVK